MKIKSNRFKCRNLPLGYEVKDKISSKSMMILLVLLGVGLILVIEKTYLIVGIVLLAFSLYLLVFSKDQTSIEFCEHFMIYYIDDQHDECYMVYYDDVENYKFVRKIFDTDLIQLKLKDGKMLEFKCLDHKKAVKNLQNYIHIQKIEDDEE